MQPIMTQETVGNTVANYTVAIIVQMMLRHFPRMNEQQFAFKSYSDIRIMVNAHFAEDVLIDGQTPDQAIYAVAVAIYQHRERLVADNNNPTDNP